jgi:hypothetical protein
MKRKTEKLSDSLHKRLNAYALAAGAAEVSLLALTQPAEARIVYTPAHVVLGKRTDITLYIDLNHDGVQDFTLDHGFASSSRFDNSGLYVRPYPSRGVSNRIMKGRYGARTLVSGAEIGPGKGFRGGSEVIVRATSPGSGLSGSWANSGQGVKNGYLGLQFLLKGKFHYGWARLNAKITQEGQGHTVVGTLTGYAYETIADKPIIAGKTKGSDTTTLGHLAQGAPAISSWRHKVGDNQ